MNELEERTQELIEICYQLVLAVNDNFHRLSLAKQLKWIQVQLNQQGYKTNVSADGCVEYIPPEPKIKLPDVSSETPMPEVKEPIKTKEEISLRDQLAMSAMSGIIERWNRHDDYDPKAIVEMVYKLADAALKIRKEEDNCNCDKMDLLDKPFLYCPMCGKLKEKEKVQLKCFGKPNCFDEEDDCPECPLFNECKNIIKETTND